uniref:Uncharacterized protein n=1 Tax=Rhizophora mucronata TaxID=61149 RepID=A0A2P2JK17_RHIMU
MHREQNMVADWMSRHVLSSSLGLCDFNKPSGSGGEMLEQ